MEKRQIKLIGNIVPLFQGANFRAQSIKYQSLRGGTIKIPLFHPLFTMGGGGKLRNWGHANNQGQQIHLRSVQMDGHTNNRDQQIHPRSVQMGIRSHLRQRSPHFLLRHDRTQGHTNNQDQQIHLRSVQMGGQYWVRSPL
jgi:hypothetical protein